MTRRRPDEPEVHRITDARRSRTDDMNRRINRYLMSMAIRTVCVLLIFVLDNPWRWFAAAGAIFLPWVAVIFANASDQRAGGPNAATVDHHGLSAGPGEDGDPSPASTVLEGEVVVSQEPGPAAPEAAETGEGEPAGPPARAAKAAAAERPAHPAA